MTKHFLIEVEGETIPVVLTSGELSVMGVDSRASLIELEPNLYSLIFNGQSHLVHLHQESDTLLTIDGQTISCTFVSDRLKLIAQYGRQKETLEITSELRAPMPGLVTDIFVKTGDTISKGQGMIILEAMKMENELRSPCTSKVRHVHVKRKEAVAINTLLIEFE